MNGAKPGIVMEIAHDFHIRKGRAKAPTMRTMDTAFGIRRVMAPGIAVDIVELFQLARPWKCL